MLLSRSRHFQGGAEANFFIGRSREPERPFFKEAPAASFLQAKKESIVVTKHDFRAIKTVNVIQKRLARLALTH